MKKILASEVKQIKQKRLKNYCPPCSCKKFFHAHGLLVQ